ncbi:COPII coat Sec23p-Sfb3p heterodimer component [Globomyces sp. JEL0801]|nr:COPII coat Sec23p-Sfb3p heterodimer component [Globomyces sp. JEL0801]
MSNPKGSSNPRFIRSTMYNIPTTSDVLKSSHIPFGIVIQPLADLAPEEAPIPVVDFGKSGPPRCSRCKAYVNPHFRFLSGGRTFTCNLCGMSNEVPQEYFSNLDMNGRRVDYNYRPELQFGSCEFSVQDEYCARTPLPVSYLFAIDVSWNSIQSGMLATFASALKFYLYSGHYSLPKGSKIGILTFDRGIHFYNLKHSLESFQMMVVGDLDEVFTPLQEGLLVDPFKSQSIIENLLDTLPTLFSSNRVGETAMGSACRAGFEALKHFGGKLSVFQTMLPSIGLGVLQNRDDAKLIGTDKEKSLFEPQEFYWKKLGQECAVNGVSVDLYLFPTTYIDIATLGTLPALSGGDIHLYNNFNANLHGVKFANDLQRTLARTFGYDALLRIRVSNGLKIEDYLGNFYMKNTTDIECAGIDSLKSFVCLLRHDGKLDERQDSYIQAALLYTTSDGQRRVRVHNLALASASQLSLVFRNASMETTNCVLARQMIQSAMTTPLSTIRANLSTICCKILVAYRTHCAAPSAPGQLILPESFKLFPLSALTLLKCRIPSSDGRVYSFRLLNSLGCAELAHYLYASVYDCTVPDSQVGTSIDSRMKVFPIVRASAARINPAGVYLVENGRHLFIYLGKEVNSETIQNIFGVTQLSAIPMTSELPTLDNPHSHQIRSVIQYLRTQRPRFMQMNICRQGLDPTNEARCAQLMIEDANFENSSYIDYLVSIHRNIQSEISNSK